MLSILKKKFDYSETAHNMNWLITTMRNPLVVLVKKICLIKIMTRPCDTLIDES